MDQLLLQLSTSVKLVTGPVKKVYAQNLRTRIQSLDDFEDGGIYLACGAEAPNKDKLAAAFK